MYKYRCSPTQLFQITKLAGFEYTKYWKITPNGEIIALRGYNIGKNLLDLKKDDVILFEGREANRYLEFFYRKSDV